MEMYQPAAVVMCCGADSLSGDLDRPIKLQDFDILRILQCRR